MSYTLKILERLGVLGFLVDDSMGFSFSGFFLTCLGWLVVLLVILLNLNILLFLYTLFHKLILRMAVNPKAHCLQIALFRVTVLYFVCLVGIVAIYNIIEGLLDIICACCR